MQIEKNFPYIIVLQGTERLTFLTVVEREILISTENFTSALLYLLEHIILLTSNIQSYHTLYLFFSKNMCWVFKMVKLFLDLLYKQ